MTAIRAVVLPMIAEKAEKAGMGFGCTPHLHQLHDPTKTLGFEASISIR
jgi:hypothetical protein